jgi:undecaprenyl-diphosphatase
MAASVLNWLEQRDHHIMRRLNRWHAPSWMRIWMVAATHAGDGWLWCGAGLVILLAGEPERFHALGAAALAVGAGILLFQSLKRLFGRKRPCAIEPHVWSTLLPPDQFSFPSGHTITAFAAAVSLGIYYPAILPVLLFCAASIGLSRIVLGMHFLSDVVAGAAIGSGLGVAAARLIH